jgi:hypothetical protein
MNVLELFAGSRSIGNVADDLGYNVFSVDWKGFDNIDLVIDVENLKTTDIPFVPDFIWASPDCTTYSIASCSTHRENSIIPLTDYAKKCDKVNTHFIKLINEWLVINPKIIFFIENPRGMMRKMPFVKGIPRKTIWYCKYGDNRAKPTDIWSNNIYNPMFNPKGWNPRVECFNGNKNCHHEEAPRGSKTGTQGRKDSYNRSMIPKELCIDVLNSATYG